MPLPRKQNIRRWVLGTLLLVTLVASFHALKREMLFRKARLVEADAELLSAAQDQWFMEHGKSDENLTLWSDVEVYLRDSCTLRLNRGRDAFGNPFIIGTGEEGITIHPDTLARFSSVLNVAEFFGEHDGRLLPPEIILAARAGDSARVRALVESGVNIDEPDHFGFTPLCWAVKLGRTEVARTICAMHPMPLVAIRGRRPCWPLSTALSDGQLQILQIFFDCGLKIDDPELVECSLDAVRHPNVLKLLLAKGLPANTTSKYGMPLIVSATSTEGTESIRLLLDAGADVNARNRMGGSETPHQRAIRLGNREAEKLLGEAEEKAGKQ